VSVAEAINNQKRRKVIMKKASIVSLVIVTTMIFCAGNLWAAEELALLTWKGYAPQSLVDKFQEETGITVKVTFSNNEEMIAKLRATRGAGFDLAQPSQDRIASVQEKYQIYQPLDMSKIDASQIIEPMLEAVKQNTMVGGQPHAVPFCWGTSGLVINKKFAPNAGDYSDLLNAMYKGRVSYRLKRPTLIALAFAMGENPFAKYGDAMAYQDLMEKVEQAMIAAKPFVKNYWTNGDALLQSMRSGEVHVAMAWDGAG
jgi:spermidine/putrescine transport system substrate-binding protein